MDWRRIVGVRGWERERYELDLIYQANVRQTEIFFLCPRELQMTKGRRRGMGWDIYISKKKRPKKK